VKMSEALGLDGELTQAVPQIPGKRNPPVVYDIRTTTLEMLDLAENTIPME
jgi:hypothetical protein